MAKYLKERNRVENGSEKARQLHASKEKWDTRSEARCILSGLLGHSKDISPVQKRVSRSVSHVEALVRLYQPS